MNGILDMSKMETVDFEITPEPFAPAAVIKNCCEILALRFSSHLEGERNRALQLLQENQVRTTLALDGANAGIWDPKSPFSMMVVMPPRAFQRRLSSGNCQRALTSPVIQSRPTYS